MPTRQTYEQQTGVDVSFTPANLPYASNPAAFGVPDSGQGRGLAQLAGALDQASGTIQQVQAREDAIWAQQTATKAKRYWMEQEAAGNLTDKNKFVKDFTKMRDDMFKAAPSGRAQYALQQSLDGIFDGVNSDFIRKAKAARQAELAQRLGDIYNDTVSMNRLVPLGEVMPNLQSLDNAFNSLHGKSYDSSKGMPSNAAMNALKDRIEQSVVQNPAEVLSNIGTDGKILGLFDKTASESYISQARTNLAKQRMAGATPQQLNEILKSSEIDVTRPESAELQDKSKAEIQRQYASNMAQMKEDGAGYFSQNPKIVALENAAKIAKPEDQAKAYGIRDAELLRLQRESGILNVNLLSKTESDLHLASINESIRSNPENAAQYIRGLRSRYGNNFSMVFSELAQKRKQGGEEFELPVEAMFIDAVSDATAKEFGLAPLPWRNEYMESLRYGKIAEQSKIDMKDFKDGVSMSAAYTKYRSYIQNLPSGSGRLKDMDDAIKRFAEVMVDKSGATMSKQDATKLAANRLIGESQSFVEYNGKSMLLSRFYKDQENRISRGASILLPSIISNAMPPKTLMQEVAGEGNAAIRKMQRDAYLAPTGVRGVLAVMLNSNGGAYELIDRNEKPITVNIQDLIDAANHGVTFNTIDEESQYMKDIKTGNIPFGYEQTRQQAEQRKTIK